MDPTTDGLYRALPNWQGYCPYRGIHSGLKFLQVGYLVDHWVASPAWALGVVGNPSDSAFSSAISQTAHAHPSSTVRRLRRVVSIWRVIYILGEVPSAVLVSMGDPASIVQ